MKARKVLAVLFRQEPGEIGESKVEEIAEQQVASDAALRRVERVLSEPDYRVRAAVAASARAARSVRSSRRMGG